MMKSQVALAVGWSRANFLHLSDAVATGTSLWAVFAAGLELAVSGANVFVKALLWQCWF